MQAAGAPMDEQVDGHALPAQSIHSLTTGEWRRRYETDGYVDLWVEEEFNAGSRVVVRHRSGPRLICSEVFVPDRFTCAATRLHVTQGRCAAWTLCSTDLYVSSDTTNAAPLSSLKTLAAGPRAFWSPSLRALDCCHPKCARR